jgi:tetratricopeptide (TPR) repeat protein
MVVQMKLPDCLKRRDILYGTDTSEKDAEHYGYLYLEAGRHNDAVEFFGRARCIEALERLRQTALAQGDFFVFARAVEFLELEDIGEDWLRLGEHAMREGKYQFGLQAFEKAGDSDGIRNARQKLDEILCVRED